MTRADELREEIVNALTHGIGAVLALAAGAVLITLAAVFGDGWQLAGAIVFGGTLLVLYLASTLYHAIPHPIAKHRLKIFDHCAIYLLIAGTYTPFTLIGLREDGGWWLFAAIWSLAAVGIVFKLFFTGRFKLLSTLIYIAMGWLALAAIGPMLRQLPTVTLVWLFAGGIAYTVGALFYMSRRLAYGHAIWHIFVIAGSVCHFVAVSTQVLARDYA
ncbi:MAG: PAQR family membrane homeostasis protein TrhA [Lysobacteraceae bacterium]|mgnify:CR=1 FL=1